MLSSRQLEELLEPQERLDHLVAGTFRRFGPKTVDLSYANPRQGPDENVRAAMREVIGENRELAFQYTPYGGSTITRRVIAESLSRDYGLPFTFPDIIMTPGAMAALNIALRGLFTGEDEVLVVTPCWQDYPLYLRNLGIPCSFVPSTADKHLDLAAIERAVKGKTKGILFSDPNCPTGVVYSKEEIEGLSRILEGAERRFGTKIYLISDEVHRHVVWTEKSFNGPLLSYPRSLVTYSFGKLLSLQGQRIGFVAVSPQMPEREEVRKALERLTRIMGFCTPTYLMQRAVCNLVNYRPRMDWLAEEQDLVRSHLRSCGYDICDGEATFFVYAKCPIPDDFRFAELMASHGVLVVPSTVFHEPGYFRLSLTARHESIVAGLPVFEKILRQL